MEKFKKNINKLEIQLEIQPYLFYLLTQKNIGYIHKLTIYVHR